MDIYEGFHCHPTVCAVGTDYQIIVPVKFEMLISVKVGEKTYYNHSNGIRISSAQIQRVTVPMKELDREKQYTIICKKMIERKPYRSVVDTNEAKLTYSFKPIEKTENINIYQIADAHGYIDETVASAEKFGKSIDLLILNGDIANSSNTFEQVITCYKIASGITEGTLPCIISRGNHDLRGKYAEVLVDHMPNRHGNSYYTFKLGCVWGILVDCGEDKVDSHEEYGETICCHEYRQDVTDYIKEVIAREEYLDDDIKYRLVLSHVPFSYQLEAPFDIEPEIYTEWCNLLKEHIKPDILLSGHLHVCAVSEFGGEYDTYGQPCPVIIGSELKKYPITGKLREYTGLGVVLNEDSAEIDFTSNKGKIERHTVPYGIPD